MWLHVDKAPVSPAPKREGPGAPGVHAELKRWVELRAITLNAQNAFRLGRPAVKELLGGRRSAVPQHPSLDAADPAPHAQLSQWP